ncbi:MAG: GntR family transcriptional regulator, partial [Erysipelotrichaceae bacterium]|nr:GntR family transcriptional regulator [Erysipelotrichaceae bacterium]
MNFKFSDDVPIYLQIIEGIKVDIVSGRYKSGDRLPAVRELAMDAGV